MLDSLSDRLNTIFRKLKGHGKLTEKNIEEGLKEVRMALLEADVHYRVVKSFIGDIKERAMGQEVLESPSSIFFSVSLPCPLSFRNMVLSLSLRLSSMILPG